MRGGIISGADTQRLVDNMFPESTLPIKIDDLYEHLVKERVIFPSSVKRKRWLSWPVWGNTRNGETERQLASFLDNLGAVVGKAINHSRPRRRFTARYSSRSPVYEKDGKVDMYRKPDVIAMNETLYEVTDGVDIGWIGVDLVVELKTSAKTLAEFLKSLGQDLGDRAFLIYEAQDGRRFVVFLSFLDTKFVMSVYDRGIMIHTSPLDIQKTEDIKLFLRIFIALTFGSDASIGRDPTIKYLPNGLHTLRVSPNGPEYEIIGVAWKNLMLQGRATVCWYVRREGEIHVVKSSWGVTLREPSEEWFLKKANECGVQGVPEVLEMGDIYVDGKLDSTDSNCGYYGTRTVDRTHRRILFKECAVPLWYFASLRELYKVFTDGLESEFSAHM